MDRPAAFRGIFRADAAARGVYSESAGIQRIVPAAVAAPVDVEDLVALLEWAKREGASLIPRGSGSSMSGAAIGPGVIVDLSRWKSIDDSRIDERRLVVGPGVESVERAILHDRRNDGDECRRRAHPAIRIHARMGDCDRLAWRILSS
jgi:hypothetical protein